MIVQWNRDSAERIPVTAPNGVHLGDITLLPGLNEVSATDWAAVESRVKDLMRRGAIVVKEKTSGTSEAIPSTEAADTAAKKRRKRVAPRSKG